MIQRLAAALAAAVLLTGSAAAAAFGLDADVEERGTVGLRLADVPPDQLGDPRSERYIVDRAAPGAQFSRRFLVTNGTDHPLDVRIHPAGVEIVDGTFTVRDELSSRIVSWMEPSPREATIPIGAGLPVDVAFDIPDDAPEGEHVGVVLAEFSSGAGPGEVEVVTRLGMRVYLSVGTGQAPAANFSVVDMTAGRADDGAAYVDVNVGNTGGRTLDVLGELELIDGPSGLRAGPVRMQSPLTLLPGDDGVAKFLLGNDVTGGPWTARVAMRSGLLERVATATLTFPDNSGSEAPPVPAEIEQQRRVLIPLASSLILILLVVAVVLLRERRRVLPRKQPPGAPSADDVEREPELV